MRSSTPYLVASRKTTVCESRFVTLIGLPPTIHEMDAFLADQSPDAY